MKKIVSLLAVAVLLFSISVGCKEKIAPFSERVAKVWTAGLVLENTAVVYSSGGTGNLKPGYSSYRLNLSSPPNATITEVDGQTYTGTYTVEGENKIVISGIKPEPTGTGGTLEFIVNSLSADNTELIVTLNGLYPKTGNTTNKYTLRAQ
jgi:hypothetical protein